MKIKYSKTSISTWENTPKKKKNATAFKKEQVGHVKSERGPLSMLFYFFAIVALFIVISLVIRFIFLYKNSTFTSSSYSVLVAGDNSFIISYDKNLNRLGVVSVPLKSTNVIKESVVLGVPIDAQVKTASIAKTSFPTFGQIVDQIVAPWKYAYKGMTMLDGVKLTYRSLSVPKKDIAHATIRVSKDGEIGGASQDELYAIFKDSDIVNEQESIEIINTTTVTGLAGMVGRVLKNIGGNVVSIQSGDEETTSHIYASKDSETLTRIARILGIAPTIRDNNSSIADIQIVLGKDFGNLVK